MGSRQLERCWGANRRAASPVALHLTGLADCPPLCLPPSQSYLRWTTRNINGSVAEHFAVHELIFISPEADDVLTSLDQSEVYVIGGLVDRSTHKCASLSLAKRLGAACARLPLKEHVPEVVSSRLPLSLVAVIQILLAVNAEHEWEFAIRNAVPLRKM